LLTHLKFTIRHVFAATVFAAIVCATIVITADPYTRTSLAAVLTGLLIQLLPALLVIGFTSYFSRRRRDVAVTGVVLFAFAWLLLPWEHLRPDPTTFVAASFTVGLISAIVAQIVVGMRSRSDDVSKDKTTLNPTKPVLYLVGGLSVFWWVILLKNLSNGSEFLIGSFTYLAFGIGTIWLGRRRYDATSRILTITWAIAMSALLAYVALSAGSLPIFAFALLIFPPVSLIAWRQPPVRVNG
jgi:hypothetical protein